MTLKCSYKQTNRQKGVENNLRHRTSISPRFCHSKLLSSTRGIVISFLLVIWYQNTNRLVLVLVQAVAQSKLEMSRCNEWPWDSQKRAWEGKHKPFSHYGLLGSTYYGLLGSRKNQYVWGDRAADKKSSKEDSDQKRMCWCCSLSIGHVAGDQNFKSHILCCVDLSISEIPYILHSIQL